MTKSELKKYIKSLFSKEKICNTCDWFDVKDGQTKLVCVGGNEDKEFCALYQKIGSPLWPKL